MKFRLKHLFSLAMLKQAFLFVHRPRLPRLFRRIVHIPYETLLAYRQASGYIRIAPTSPATYRELYRVQKSKLAQGENEFIKEHLLLATTTTLAIDRLRQRYPEAVELLILCAFMGPDAIPEKIIFQCAHYLPTSLRTLTHNQTRWRMSTATLRNYVLLRRHAHTGTLTMPRLIQELIRATQTQAEQVRWAEYIINLTASSFSNERQASSMLNRLIFPTRCKLSATSKTGTSNPSKPAPCSIR
ncbi:DUF7779 domain-containing protein [Dictyobacter kobayashii]|uniref:DUF7779 domain-containing protein n=1 Tax=Dictyobacter kobayashii TaxID=2014872 RepID=A0A402AQ32_9CHLR|nr:hypothetical protein [Dictyobacter kobayashii]GCE21202.1 hypothetical protein KDK_50020 [Dictyobacter kobayashii]